MQRNWITSIAGTLTLIVTVCQAVLSLISGLPVDGSATSIGITAGLGLLAARDHNK